MTLSERREVIFVGGTPHTGAEAVAELLAAHSDAAALRAPARFASDPRGIGALLAGRLGLDDFATEVRGRLLPDGAPPDRVDGALAKLRAAYEADPLAACRELFWALLEPLMRDGGVPIDASPENLIEAQTLQRLAPDARFVHVLRDGRDAAAAAQESGSVAGGLAAGLESWADGLREVERGIRGEEDGAPYEIGADRFATVVLDELAAGDAGASARELLERLALADSEAVRAAADRISVDEIGRGRWRAHARGPARWWVPRRYARVLGQLAEEGNHAAAPLLAAYERLG